MAVFITFEGGDGSGKSTLLARLEYALRNEEVSFLTTREPGGTPLGEKIRELLIEETSPLAELFLLEAARAEHVEKLIKPSLKKGVNVLCDRFTHSSMAYQGAALGLKAELVEKLNRIATAGLMPHATVWLRLPPEIAIERMQKRQISHRFDEKEISFHKKVFRAYEKLSKLEKKRFIVLNATLTQDEIYESLLAHPLWKQLRKKM
ncbi:MAG: dTMP kinase [Bacteriovoracia bacterium]